MCEERDRRGQKKIKKEGNRGIISLPASFPSCCFFFSPFHPFLFFCSTLYHFICPHPSTLSPLSLPCTRFWNSLALVRCPLLLHIPSVTQWNRSSVTEFPLQLDLANIRPALSYINTHAYTHIQSAERLGTSAWPLTLEIDIKCRFCCIPPKYQKKNTLWTM